MQIFIKLPTGLTTTLEVLPTDKIEDVKAKLAAKVGIQTDVLRLTFKGKSLEEGRTLEDYSVENECTIHTVPLLRG